MIKKKLIRDLPWIPLNVEVTEFSNWKQIVYYPHGREFTHHTESRILDFFNLTYSDWMYWENIIGNLNENDS